MIRPDLSHLHPDLSGLPSLVRARLSRVRPIREFRWL